MMLFEAARETIEGLQSRAVMGRVQSIRGLTVIVDQLRIPVGSIVRIESRSQTREPIRGEVVGFQGDASIVMLYDESGGISPGDCCIGERNSATVPVGTALLGRTIDGLGRPIDGRETPTGLSMRPLHPNRMRPLSRTTINDPIATGIRTIDGLTPSVAVSDLVSSLVPAWARAR